MRRVSAICALSAIWYTFIAPLAFADPESALPLCCRRNGAHHCSMKTADATPPVDGPAFQAIRGICPACPATTAGFADGSVALLQNSGTIFAGLVSRPSIQRQTEARSRVSFSRSRLKRGPPAILS